MRIVWPGAGRLTLAALAIVPAAMAYPWQTVTERWVLGIAAALVIILFGWWRGLHWTTLAWRRVALLFSRNRNDGARHQVARSVADARTTAVLRVVPESDGDLPLDLIAGYLHRYGLQSESVRVTSRDTKAGRTTWVGMTMAAAPNLAALQARSPQIPLRDTAEVALRRLADHLREEGWSVSTADIDVPDPLGPDAKEKWRAIEDGSKGYLAVYAVNPDDALPEVLAELWAQTPREVWTTISIGRGGRISAACAVRTDEAPEAAPPVDGLVSVRGRQIAALHALAPDSVHPLHAPTGPGVLLEQVRWPAGRATVTA